MMWGGRRDGGLIVLRGCGAALFFTLIVGSGLASAEPSHELPPPPPPMREPGVHQIEKMREVRGRLLREGVKLTEHDARAVEKVLESFDLQQRAAKRSVHQARRELHLLLDRSVKDEGRYRSAIEQLRAAHEAMHRIKEERLDALMGVLPPQKTARLLVMLGKLHHERKRRPGHRPGKSRPQR